MIHFQVKNINGLYTVQCCTYHSAINEKNMRAQSFMLTRVGFHTWGARFGFYNKQAHVHISNNQGITYIGFLNTQANLNCLLS